MNVKPTLLICLPDFPFPIRKNGLSIRYLPIIEHASKNFDVHLLCILDNELPDAELDQAKKICKNVYIYNRIKRSPSAIIKVVLKLISLIPGQTPFSQLCYDRAEIQNFIRTKTSGKHFDNVLCVLGIYAKLLKKSVDTDFFAIDFVDSPFSLSKRLLKPSLFSYYDLYLIKLWENNIAKSANFSCYISPLDKDIAASNLNKKIKMEVIPNGFNISDYTTNRMQFDHPVIGFLGHMGYKPNIKAALRLYSIFKRIQDNISNAKLLIIGRDPAPEILALKSDPNVIVTGSIDSIWPYVNATDFFVFPMEIGSGQQNKILEAFAAGRPVISSSLGNSGIGAKNYRDILIADTDEEIGEAIHRLTSDQSLRETIGKNGLKYVNSNYPWEAIFEKIDRLMIPHPHKV